MKNTPLSTAVILFAFNFVGLESSPTPIRKTPTDSATKCDRALEDLHLPHESSCSRYYRCVYGRKVLKICPEKMLFNRAIGNCDLFYNVDCPSTEKQPDDDSENHRNSEEAIEHLTGKTFHLVNAHAPTELDTMAEHTIISKPSDTATSKFVYVPHDENPGAYYQIENGVKSLMVCDEGMIFSMELEICARAWGFKWKM